MNICLIVSDTVRKDALGCYGKRWIQTPSLDKLAEESFVFEKAYAGSFPTMPMRAELMTGTYCFQSFGWAPLPPGTLTLQSLLQKSGYVTVMITDHFQMFAPGYNYHQGFSGVEWIRGQMGDMWVGTTEPLEVKLPCDPKKLRTDQDVDPEHLLRWLKNVLHWRNETDWICPRTFQAAIQWLERNYTQKFFLYLDCFDTHEPWTPPPWYVELYDPGYEGEVVIYPRYDYSEYLSRAELHHLRSIYGGNITLMDRWLGKLLEKIRQLGLWDKTLIIFISDHGFLLGEHNLIGKHAVLSKKGWPFYEEVSHIPLLIKLPQQKEGKRTKILVQPVDIMPTILELVGIKVPETIHGFSFLSGLKEGGTSPRKLAVTSPPLPTDPEYCVYSTITDGEWTLIYGGNKGKPELYHLPSDPGQSKNLYQTNFEVAKRLHREYLDFLENLGTEEGRLKLQKKLPN